MSGYADGFKDKATSGTLRPSPVAIERHFDAMNAVIEQTSPVRVFHAQLDYPPSANRYWRVFRGMVVKSKEAREYQKSVALRFAGRKPMRGNVIVSLNVFRPRKSGDLDNTVKVLLDALKKIAYVDDSQVVELHVWRNDDKFNPRVVVKCELEK